MSTIDLNEEMKRQQRVLVADKLMLTFEEARELLGIGRNTLIAFRVRKQTLLSSLGLR